MSDINGYPVIAEMQLLSMQPSKCIESLSDCHVDEAFLQWSCGHVAAVLESASHSTPRSSPQAEA